MIKTYAILCCLFITITGFSQSWQWGKVFLSEGGNNTYVASMSSDSKGNTYVAGKFSKNITLSKAYNGNGIFFCKLDIYGKISWEKVFTGAVVQYPSISATGDSLGNLFLLIYSDHALQSENSEMIDQGTSLLHFNSEGKRINNSWIIGQENTIHLSQAGKYLTSVLRTFGPIQIGTTTITDKGFVIIQTDTAGKFNWRAVLPSNLHARASATKEDGSVVVTGEFQDSATIGNFKIKSSGNTDAFLLHLEKNGTVRYLRSYGQSGVDMGVGVAFGLADHIYLTGDKTLNAFFTKQNDYSSFIAELDENGNVIWGMQTGEPTGSFPSSRNILADKAGDVFFTGNLKEDIYFNWLGAGITLTHSSGLDSYAAVLPYSTGNEYGLSVSGKGDEKSTSLSITSNGDLVFAGTFTDSVKIGKSQYAGAGIYVCKSFFNHLPVLEDFATQSAEAGKAFQFIIYGQDVDSDSLFATAEGLPEGFSLQRIDEKTFKIVGTPTASQIGNYAVSISLSDNFGVTTKTLPFKVVSAGTYVPLTITDSNLPLVGGEVNTSSENLSYTFNNPPDQTSLVYNVGANYHSAWSEDGKTLTITFQNLRDSSDYHGFISISDFSGTNYQRDIGFKTSFAITPVEEKREDQIAEMIIVDLQGRIISNVGKSLLDGPYVIITTYTSGKVKIKKMFINEQ